MIVCRERSSTTVSSKPSFSKTNGSTGVPPFMADSSVKPSNNIVSIIARLRYRIVSSGVVSVAGG
jgi:hypothetical protein